VNVVSGRGLCDGLITRPEESYRWWCVWVWSWSLNNEEALTNYGLLRLSKKCTNYETHHAIVSFPWNPLPLKSKHRPRHPVFEYPLPTLVP
jgi:hypothetical protein